LRDIVCNQADVLIATAMKRLHLPKSHHETPPILSLTMFEASSTHQQRTPIEPDK